MSAMETTVLREGRADLAAIIGAYNEVTERLRESHEKLQGQVERLREELADKNRELARRQRLASLGQMAAGLAHEIRNPLGAIRLNASLLEKDVSGRAGEMARVQKIVRGVGQLEALVTDVLTFAGEIQLRAMAVDAAALIGECVEQLAPLVERYASQVVVDVEEGRTVIADAHQLRLAVTNLVRNALEAAGRGGCVRIALAGGDEGGELRLRVEDDGPGIGASHIEKIFDPFFTTKDSGTGLGLATVHRIVEAHGGKIEAGNIQPRGARFEVRLPQSRNGAARPVKEDRTRWPISV